MLQIDIRPRASAQIDDAVDYYSTVASPDTAQRFIDSFQAACHLLAQRPDVGSRRYAHLLPGLESRCWTLDHFPYRIFYVHEQSELQILAVVHERRDLDPQIF